MDLEDVDIRDWLDRYWLVVYFGVDLVLFALAIYFWKPGSRPLAGGLFVVALTFPLAFIGVVVSNLLVGDAEVESGRTR